MVALMFDTSIALCRIILSGILDEYPKLKLVCPHLGGTLPYLIGRIDHQTQVLKRGAEHITKPPSAYLKNVWLDIVSPSAPAPAILGKAADEERKGSLQRRLGRAFSERVGRRYGMAGLHLTKAGSNRKKVALWRVRGQDGREG
jgi:hypothetical protein